MNQNPTSNNKPITPVPPQIPPQKKIQTAAQFDAVLINALTTDENVNFIIDAIKQKIDKRPGLLYDPNKILDKKYIINKIMKNIRRPTPWKNTPYTPLEIANIINTDVINTSVTLLNTEDPHWNPNLGRYEYSDRGFDISSIKNGWRPQDFIYNSAPNRALMYKKPQHTEIPIKNRRNLYNFVRNRVRPISNNVKNDNIENILPRYRRNKKE